MKLRMGRRGFTLIEIMISIAVLAILVVGIYSALSASQSLYVTGVTRQEIDDRVRRVLESISAELRLASGGVDRPITFGTTGSAGDELVTFCVCTGFTGTAATYGTPVTIGTIAGDGDVDNGADDNNNRMVDERKIIRTQAGVINKVLADNVREGSLRFTRTMTGGAVNRIQIDVTLQGIDSRGRVIESSGNVVVDLRNQ